MLWLCLHLSDLPLEIYRRAARRDGPLIIGEGEGREQRVVAASNAARRCGVAPGMRVAEAHALASGLRVKARDAAAEREALERLAALSVRYTSAVSLVPPDALLLEIEGSLKLYGDIDSLIERLHDDLRELGYTARLAVAPTPLGATWLARAGREAWITDHAALFRALAELPLACLQLDAKREALLAGLGLGTLIDCLRLPRDGIARRVGPEILDALDRAFGRLPDPRAAFTPPARFRARLGLPAPVTAHEAILFPLRRLLRELARFLEARGAGAAAIDIALHSTRAQSTSLPLRLVAPSRDANHFTALARDRLERLALAAPVEEVIVEVDALLPLAPRPLDCFAGATTPQEQRAQIVERLQARLGREAVSGIDCVADHRPERAWRSVDAEALIATDAPRDSDIRTRTVDHRASFVQEGSLDSAQSERWPLWLLPEPRALEVREEQPYCGGARALEPECERIESGWWDAAEIARDYFVVRNPQGRRLWVFRGLRTAQWFLHGVFG